MSKAYVFCPENIVSGGPEALHQLVDSINCLGGHAYVVFFNENGISSNARTPMRYQCYNAPIAQFLDIEFHPNNSFIAPESRPDILDCVTSGRRLIWWLSVDFRKSFNYELYPNLWHAYQSEHAKQYLAKIFLNSSLWSLSDYVVVYSTKKVLKRNIIAITKRKLDPRYDSLIAILKNNFNVVFVQNMSRIRLATLLAKTKVFVDFGSHPGKDRLPREAAVQGNIVITSGTGACLNEKDVNISKRFKLSHDLGETALVSLIQVCFDNYKSISSSFENYRIGIQQEKLTFFTEVNNLFQLGNDKLQITNIVLNHTLILGSFKETAIDSRLGFFIRKVKDYLRIKIRNHMTKAK